MYICIFLGSEETALEGLSSAFSVGKEGPTEGKKQPREDGGVQGQFPYPSGRFQQMGLTFPGTSPPGGSAAHLGSTSSCQGPATLCQDRHTRVPGGVAGDLRSRRHRYSQPPLGWALSSQASAAAGTRDAALGAQTGSAGFSPPPRD